MKKNYLWMVLFRRSLITLLFIITFQNCYSWGFFAHRKINYYAVFLLPSEMIGFYKKNINYLTEHAVDPDKRRSLVSGESAKHFIDIDHYGVYPFEALPRKWEKAVEKYSSDTLKKYGIVPWWIATMKKKLTEAFETKDRNK